MQPARLGGEREREGVSNRSQPGLLWSVGLAGFSERFRSVVKTERVKREGVLEQKQKEMKKNPPVTCRQILTTTAEFVCCSHTNLQTKELCEVNRFHLKDCCNNSDLSVTTGISLIYSDY